MALKIADFGVAKLLNKSGQDDFYAGTRTGTPTYLAPEVPNMKNLGAKTAIIHVSGTIGDAA